MANLPKRSPEKEQVILNALRERPTYASAARKARIARTTLTEWRKDDPEFNAACIAARNEGLDAIEDKLLERGMKNDTTAAIFMLKSLRRDIYGDKLHHSGRVDHVHRSPLLHNLSVEELEHLESIALNAMEREHAT